MRFPREVVEIDPERREVRFTAAAAVLGFAVLVLGWPSFYGLLWFAAHAAAWVR